MNRLSKYLTLFSVIIIVTSLNPLIIKQSNAQTTNTLSPPEFTITQATNSFIITITNQPSNSSIDEHAGIITGLFYTINFYDQNEHHNSYFPYSNSTVQYDNLEVTPASNSKYTIITFPVDSYPLNDFPKGAQIDVRVIGMLGSLFRTDFLNITHYSFDVSANEVTSSEPQTITIPYTNTYSPTLYVSPIGQMSTSYRLSLYGPNNQSSYYNNMLLNFTLNWSFDLMPLFEPMTNYSFSIDDTSFVTIVPNQHIFGQSTNSTKFVNNPSFAYPISISNLSEGYHKVVIKASFSFGGHLYLDSASTPFYFYVQKINPSPTLPNMGPTESPIPNNADLNVTLTLIIIAILVVTVVSLLLYVRHPKRSS